MKRKELILLLCLFFSFAAVSHKRVPGLVRDEQGYPIPGATILELGITNGVIADVDGNFSLVVASESSVLQVSCVGMQTQAITVGNQSHINIIMVSALSALAEV